MFGEPYSVPGFGKVYVRFSNEEEAERAKHVIFILLFLYIFVCRRYLEEDLMEER